MLFQNILVVELHSYNSFEHFIELKVKNDELILKFHHKLQVKTEFSNFPYIHRTFKTKYYKILSVGTKILQKCIFFEVMLQLYEDLIIAILEKI